jgi:uncharacterized glyoxalase superfamily protein PhnB
MSSRAKLIPNGFHTLTPHLVVKGASKAIDFYQKAFGAEELGRLPGPDGKSILHADLKSETTATIHTHYSGGGTVPARQAAARTDSIAKSANVARSAREVDSFPYEHFNH